MCNRLTLRRATGLVWALVLALGGLLFVTPGPAHAATLTVCVTGCAYTSISDALAAANDGDNIAVGAGRFSGGFTITKAITLQGAGADMTMLIGGNSVVTVAQGVSVVTIRELTVTFGTSTSLGGGGILNEAGSTVTLSDTTITGNTATGSGGGIFNESGATLTVRDSTITGNMATGSGGGIFNESGATLRLNNSTVSGNIAGGGGGGGIDNSGVVIVTDSTLDANMTSGFGGGISNSVGLITISNSVLSGNTAASGGGIYNSVGSVTINDSTVSGNTAGGSATGGGGGGGGILNLGVLLLNDSTITGNLPTNCVGRGC